MKGALLELVARGEEDIWLIGNPSISFFKSVHKRHTNFSRFESKQIFYGQPNFGKTVTLNIEKKGDLLSNIMLEIKLPATGNSEVSWINGIGNYIIQEATFKIGGETIHRMSGEFIDTYYKYYYQLGHYANYTSMIKRVSGYRKTSQPDSMTLYVMIPLWFTKEPSQALPVISLGYHDITLEIKFRPLIECLFNNQDKSTLTGFNLDIIHAYVWCDFYYLDKHERQMFLNKPELNYLIEQVNDNIFSVATGEVAKTYSLTLSHPVKELVFIYRSTYYTNINKWDNYLCYNSALNTDLAPLDELNIQLDGNDRTVMRDADYYRLVQPVLHHNSCNTDYVYMYSFANNADSLQPSGTVNFSQIDDSKLVIRFHTYITDGTIYVWSKNYNMLKIKQGMAGILYS